MAKAVVAGYDVWCDECGEHIDSVFSIIEARAVARRHNQDEQHKETLRRRRKTRKTEGFPLFSLDVMIKIPPKRLLLPGDQIEDEAAEGRAP